MKLYQTIVQEFSWKNRIRILFGCKVYAYGTIEVDKDVRIVGVESRAEVMHFFQKKSKRQST